MFKFPYAVCDFHRIQTENYFYVDRTNHIRLIEEFGDQLLFLRPRCFGKTLLLSLLENYYDVVKANEFDRLFGHLAIGQNPTPKHNQYFVLKWDFSSVSPEGEIDEIRHRLHRYVNRRIQKFADDYQALLPKEVHIEPDDAIDSFYSLLNAVKRTPYRLYLLIDEYDNFANELMMDDREISKSRYEALLSGEGALKSLFKAVKSASSGEGLERVFITGVSPVVLSDMTSGYNVAENIYFEPEFNDLCGFRESEIASVLSQIVKECGLPPHKTQEALTIMQTFYNGYCFNDQVTEFIYNPTLALSFLKSFQQHCKFPRRMLDSSLAMDREKISYISRLPNGEQLILRALDEDSQLSVSQLADRFGVYDMLNATLDTTFMVSLLYYLGVLTLAGETELGELSLKIPNLVVRKLYVERIKEILLPDVADRTHSQQLAKRFYQTGNLQPVCEFVEQRYFKVFDNRDYSWANELTIKTAFLTVLYDDVFYMMESETPVNRLYADLTLLVRPERRQPKLLDFLLEFKYIRLSEENLSAEQVRQMSYDDVKALTLVQKKLAESENQLKNYSKALKSKYGDVLRLQTYSVVALGFERVVWQQVSKK